MKTLLRLLPAFSFWLLSSLLHLKFSLFLVQPIEIGGRLIKLKNYAPEVAYVFIFLLVIFLFWHFFTQYLNKKNQQIIFYLWLVWIVMVLFINHYLLATALENIHFVQYAIIALLFLWAIKPAQPLDLDNLLLLIAKTLFWVTLAGIIDEFMQYLWITASYSKHLDFNDFVLNLMGAIAGVLIYLSFKLVNLSDKFIVTKINVGIKNNLVQLLHSWEMRLIILLTLFFCFLGYFDYVQITTIEPINEGGSGLFNQQISLFFERSPNLLGSWNNKFNGGKYYILSTLEGMLLLLLVAFGFYWGIIKALKVKAPGRS